MRALVYDGPGKVSLEQRPKPEIRVPSTAILIPTDETSAWPLSLRRS